MVNHLSLDFSSPEFCSDDLHRQRVSLSLFEATGTYQIEDSERDNKRLLTLGETEGVHHQNKTYSKEVKCHRRQPLPGQSDSSHGVDPKQRSVSEVVREVRHPGDRLICDLLESQVTKFVSPVTDPLAYAVDAMSVPWTGIYGYVFPSVSHDSPGPPENQDRQSLSPPYLSPQVVQILDFHSPVPAGVGPPSTPPAQFPPTTDPTR